MRHGRAALSGCFVLGGLPLTNRRGAGWRAGHGPAAPAY